MDTSNYSGSSSTNVLSDKVQHAVSTVRVDSVGMQTALDVLASSASFSAAAVAVVTPNNNNNNDNNPKKFGMTHHKSVRVAIEEDALQQAWKLQDELQKIVTSVEHLQKDVLEMTAYAKRVRDSLQDDVVSKNNHHPRKKEDYGDDNDDEWSKKNNNEEELALTLKEAFERRDVAAHQYNVICHFMEKFNVSESDAYLLEHAVLDMSHPQEGVDFLTALERVGHVKNDLTQEFHNSHSTNTSTTDASSSLALLTDTSSAVRIMETLAHKQSKAYDRLYNFVHAIFDPHLASSSSTSHHAMVPTSSKAIQEAPLQQQQQEQQEEALSVWMEEALQMPFLQKALQTLQAGVPHYYTHTLELIATSRRTLLTKKFLLALTSGGQPLERMAHDPVVYVGEMLAFCYQSILLECDLLQGIHQKSSSNNNNNNDSNHHQHMHMDQHTSSPHMTSSSTSSSPHMTIVQVLNHIVSGTTRPLKSRIIQVMASLSRNFHQTTTTTTETSSSPAGASFAIKDDVDDEEEDFSTAQNRITQLYSICGLLLFYGSAMTKTTLKLVVHPNNETDDQDDEEDNTNPMVQCVHDCLKEAARSYAASIHVYAAHIITHHTNTTTTTPAPAQHAVTSTTETACQLIHSLLTKLCQVRLDSPGFGPSSSSTSSETLEEVATLLKSELSLKTTFQILLDRTALENDTSILHTLEDASLLKLAIAAAKKAGMEKDCCTKWERQITTLERQMADSMIDADTKEALQEVGLQPILSCMEQHSFGKEQDGSSSSSSSLSRHMSQTQVEQSLRNFYASLYAPPLPMYETWKDPVLRKYARSKVAQNIIQAYTTIYNAVTSSYADTSFVGHSPDQVKVLLSL